MPIKKRSTWSCAEVLTNPSPTTHTPVAQDQFLHSPRKPSNFDNDTPQEHHDTQTLRSSLLENQARRQSEHDVRDSKEHDGYIVVVPFHVQLLCHPLDFCVSYVPAIQEGYEHEKAYHRQDLEIELTSNASLDIRDETREFVLRGKRRHIVPVANKSELFG
jgi:hypothetical protein